MKKLLVIIAAIAATHLSPAFAIEMDVIERAQAAFAAQLALKCVPSAQADWVAEDAVYQYALSGIDVSLRIEGRAAVAAHLCALSAADPNANVDNVHYSPTLDPEVVFVQYEQVPVDAAATRTNTLAIIEMRGNQITNFTQLNRSPESLQIVQAATRGKN